MIFFLDTEFNEFGGDLISLAMVGEDGSELYVATDCPNPGNWVRQHVMPIIKCPGAEPVMIPPDAFGKAIMWFFQEAGEPRVIADWPDDISYFCKAMITAPGEMVAIPKLQFDLRRVDAYPTTLPGAIQHNALWDARALRHAIQRL